MKSLRLVYSFFVLTLLVSCSQDQGNDDIVYDDGSDIEDNIVITHLKQTYKDYDGGVLYSFSNYSNDLIDNKFLTGTFTYNQPWPSTDSITTVGNQYIYEGGRLVSETLQRPDGESRSEFHYNAEGKLEAAELRGNYYHFSYPSEHIVISELLTLPYGNTAAEISKKIILRFSKYDNLIGVGEDADGDNLPDTEAKFIHRNGNVVKAIYGPNIYPNVYEHEYTDIINTSKILKELTYGKVNYILINSTNTDFPGLLSRNIKVQSPYDYSETTYEVNAQHFFTKREYKDLRGERFYYDLTEFTLE